VQAGVQEVDDVLQVDTPVGLDVEPGISRIERREFEGTASHVKTK
jgi:hypothetical protein